MHTYFYRRGPPPPISLNRPEHQGKQRHRTTLRSSFIDLQQVIVIKDFLHTLNVRTTWCNTVDRTDPHIFFLQE